MLEKTVCQTASLWKFAGMGCVGLFLAAGFAVGTLSFADKKAIEKLESETEVLWVWPVATAETSSKEVQVAVEQLWNHLGIKLIQKSTQENPGCCLWVEVGTWNPNPSEPGYLILIQPGGGRLIASDLEQLELAEKRLIKVAKQNDGQLRLPIGLLTNYPVIAD